MLLWPTPDLATLLQQTGADRITLAFVVADRQSQPTWGGVQPWNWDTLLAMVRRVGPSRVVASFGGANGTELADAVGDDGLLLKAVLQTVDTFAFDAIDFDIEGAAIAQVGGVRRRNRLIRQLNVLRPNLKINYTLPVMRTGLTSDGESLLADAKTQGCRIGIVNCMTMDYGGPVPDMGRAAVDAARAVKAQVDRIGLSVDGIGITPMIGRNDVAEEVFSQSDARVVAEFAASTRWLKWVSMWSCARDTSKPGPLYASSNVPQADNAFAAILRGRL
jgi:chitinase